MRRQILLSIVIRFLIYWVHWMVLAYLPLLLKSGGMDDARIGGAIALFSLSSMVLMLPLGFCSDFFSPRRTLFVGALLYAAYFAGLAAQPSYGWLLGVMVLGGVGSAALIVVSESLYLKHFGQVEQGRRVALYQAATYLGFGLGPLVGGLLVQQAPAILFGLGAAGALGIAGLACLLVDYDPIVFSFRGYGEDAARFKPLLLAACLFVLALHFGVEQSSLSLLLRHRLGFSMERIGFIFAGLGLWMALLVPLVGRLHDRRQSVFLFFLGGLAVSGLFQALTSLATGFWSLFAARLLHTMGDTVAMLEFGVLVALLFPSRRLGGSSGLLYGVRALATFLAALASGLVNQRWGYHVSFGASGLLVLCFVAACLAYIGLSPSRRREVGWEQSP
ncbi:MAG: MFS transporter [Thermodesulfobacteriota bacterium]